jgi:amino acid permease
MDPIIIPILGISVGIIVPISIFILLYFEAKDKNKTILEISKNIDDPAKVEDLLSMLDERKKEPIDYRRGGLITLFVGLGIYLLGNIAMGRFFEGVGLLVGAIGIGTMLAGYMYPNTSEEITNAVDEYEKR